MHKNPSHKYFYHCHFYA
nr:hypothetical protein [Staphylococcus capitis]